MKSGLRRTSRLVLAVMYREWHVHRRAYRISFFVAIGLGSLFTLLIGHFLYHTVFDGQVTGEFVALAGTDDYVTYLTIGIVVYTFTARLLYPVRNFLEEQWEGTLPVIAMMGMPRLPYHLGCVLFSATYSALEVAVLMAIVWISLGVDFSGAHWGGVLAALGAGFIGLYGLSLAMAALILHASDRVVIEGASFSLMMLLCGVVFPTAYLPYVLQLAAEAVPLTHILRALRAAALAGVGPGELGATLFAVVGLGLVYLAAGKLLLERTLRRVIEQTA